MPDAGQGGFEILGQQDQGAQAFAGGYLAVLVVRADIEEQRERVERDQCGRLGECPHGLNRETRPCRVEQMHPIEVGPGEGKAWLEHPAVMVLA